MHKDSKQNKQIHKTKRKKTKTPPPQRYRFTRIANETKYTNDHTYKQTEFALPVKIEKDTNTIY